MSIQLFGLARLGRDAEVRYTPGGDAVANLNLAFNYGRKVDGKKPTQWVDGALWGKLAEALSEYLTKGTTLAVTLDDVHIESYQNKGETHHKLVGRVTSVELAGGPRDRAAEPEKADDDIPF